MLKSGENEGNFQFEKRTKIKNILKGNFAILEEILILLIRQHWLSAAFLNWYRHTLGAAGALLETRGIQN